MWISFFKHQVICQKELFMDNLIKVNKIIKQDFPEDILLYENAGLIKKVNTSKTEFIRKVFEVNGFKTITLESWRYGVRGRIVNRIIGGDFEGWEINKISSYKDDVPIEIVRKMALIKDKENLLILTNPREIDPVLIYELPFLNDEKYKVCVILTEWE